MLWVCLVAMASESPRKCLPVTLRPNVVGRQVSSCRKPLTSVSLCIFHLTELKPWDVFVCCRVHASLFYDQLFGKEAAVCLSASSLAERNKVIPLMFTHSSYKEEEGICCMVGKYCCRLSVMKPSGGIGGLHVLFSVPYPTCTSTRYKHTQKKHTLGILI